MNKVRQKCFLHISSWLVLIVYSQTLEAIQTSTLSPLLQTNTHEYNITEYLSDASLEPELRLAVGEALLAEGDADVNRCNPSRGPLPPPACPPMKFRLPSGACDNVRYPRWGSVGQPFLRLVPPVYADGKSIPRKNTNGNPLPEPESTARLVESLMKEGEEPPLEESPIHPHLTALTGAWAQLVAEDFAKIVHPSKSQCCNGTILPECYTGEIQEQNQCQEYVRAAPTRKDPCEPFKYRETMNLASAFLDGSGIYGTSETTMNSLRVGFGGRIVNPSSKPPLHRLFLAEHNRLANELSIANPHWDDEDLFLEARRIVIAEIQHITYSEWLPVVVGDMKELRLQIQGYFHGYSSGHEAGVYAPAILAALTPLNGMLDDENQQGDYITKLASWSKILARKPSINSGPHYDGWTSGARLIHMGRDIGLAPYEDFAKFCNVSIEDSLPDAARVALLKHYDSNNKMTDIDLIAGGILETPLPGAALGPTLSCILTYQFIKTRNSDRFWYENDIPPSSLSKDQLQEIRKVRLANILCANSELLSALQPHAFVREDSYLNARLPCDLHPLPDVASAWRAPEPIPQLPDEMVMQAVKTAEEEMRKRREREYQFWTVHGGVDPKSPIGTAAAFSKANKQALAIANYSLVYEFASLELLNQLSRDRRGLRRRRQVVSFLDADTEAAAALASPDAVDALANGLHEIDVSVYLPVGLPDGAECDDNDNVGHCDPLSPFRTITGWCNNLRNPGLGKSLSPFARLLPPGYENGVAKPRLHSTTGSPLPSARLVSTTIHADISNLHNRYTLMLMQFAQFLDHDLTFTPQHRGFFASIPDCRSCDSARTVHPECMPIELPPGDHYYPAINQTSGERFCLPFMRSLPGQLHLGAREQLNQNSAFLDGSVIYGEHLCMARHLRGFGGRMNATISPQKGAKELLPQTSEHPECKAPSGLCFVGGDGRASEQPALTVIHTIYLREHNRIADGLRELNPHWDQEKIYQHARRIVVAGLQHVTYNEFLPRILGWAAVSLYELKLRPQGYFKGYNPNCNPNVVNEFAAAAFRIGHSLLRPHIPRMSPQYQVVDPPLLLRNNFFNPDVIYQPHMIDEISRGLVSTPMENLDQFITGEITNHLFEDRRIPRSGVDLIALNVQRARDHGLRSYNDYRALCNLKRASTFEDLSREIPSEVIARFRRIYASVDDIDLFPGGMSERPLQGGLVGPTFACIIGLQFRQLRKCDRFWYETDDPAIRFTERQLAEIRKITVAKVMCQNLDHGNDMQRSAFDQPSSFLNPRLPCHSLPNIDLSAWREAAHGCQIGGRHVQVGESGLPSPCTSCICTAEGAQCASLRVTDCAQLLREANRDAIIRDDVCMAQCGGLVLGSVASRGRSLPALDLLPPAPRSRQRPTSSAFSPFKLHDLSFLG